MSTGSTRRRSAARSRADAGRAHGGPHYLNLAGNVTVGPSGMPVLLKLIDEMVAAGGCLPRFSRWGLTVGDLLDRGVIDSRQAEGWLEPPADWLEDL